MICRYTSAILDVERHLAQRIWTAIGATQGIKMAGVLHWTQGGRWKVINEQLRGLPVELSTKC